MSLFNYDNYRTYLRAQIKALPKRGRGELAKIARHLQINTTLLSQIFSGAREFTVEQALELSRYLGHTEVETDYFMLLVQKERASTPNMREHVLKKLVQTKAEALKLSKLITPDKKLEEAERAIFYSSYLYSAVHLFTSVKSKGVTLDEVMERFDLPRARAVEVLQFLLKCGLCLEESGYYTMGLSSTMVEQGSPHLLRHLSNWRIKAIQKSETLQANELMYAGQFSLSREDFNKIRRDLAEFLKKAMDTVRASPAEELACLNVDWFWLDK